MMPVKTPDNHQDESVDYKKKYKVLKRKIKMLLCENECFLEELRKAQRKLLRVTRDKNFLLDRLLQHEPTEDTSDDSEATQTSDSEAETSREVNTPKKKKSVSLLGFGSPIDPALIIGSLIPQPAAPQDKSPGSLEPPRKKAKIAKKNPKSGKSLGNAATGSHLPPGVGQMTREELERHLEFKQSTKPQFMSIEKAPNSLPDDIFSNDSSNQEAEVHLAAAVAIKEEEDDSDLVIDVPQG